MMCTCVKAECLVAGWGCCACTIYNGLQNKQCRNCGKARCSPLKPDKETGEKFETYDEAYADDEDMLNLIKKQLRS